MKPPPPTTIARLALALEVCLASAWSNRRWPRGSITPTEVGRIKSTDGAAKGEWAAFHDAEGNGYLLRRSLIVFSPRLAQKTLAFATPCWQKPMAQCGFKPRPEKGWLSASGTFAELPCVSNQFRGQLKRSRFMTATPIFLFCTLALYCRERRPCRSRGSAPGRAEGRGKRLVGK